MTCNFPNGVKCPSQDTNDEHGISELKLLAELSRSNLKELIYRANIMFIASNLLHESAQQNCHFLETTKEIFFCIVAKLQFT